MESTYRPETGVHLARESMLYGYESERTVLLKLLRDEVRDKVRNQLVSRDRMDGQVEFDDQVGFMEGIYQRENLSIGKDREINGDIRGYGSSQLTGRDRMFGVVKSEDLVESNGRDYKRRNLPDGKDGLDEDSKLAGLIFMCNKRTKEDCFHHSLFGLPYNRWNLVKQVEPGTVLFLFEYEARQMWGIYEATSHGQLNIEPFAYKTSKGSFPAQVRFREYEKCPPLEESDFKEAIKDNYISDVKFKFTLSREQVLRLSKLFLWKSTGRNMSSLDQEIAYVEHHDPDGFEEIRDHRWIPDERHDYEALQEEAYIPVEVTGKAGHTSSEGRLQHGNLLEILTSSDYVPQMKYPDPSQSDRTDQQLLSVKADDRLYLGYQSDLLFKPQMFGSFKEVSTSGMTVNNDSPEKDWDGAHPNANRAMYAPGDRDAYILNDSDAPEVSKARSRSRSLVDMYHSFEFAPSASAEPVSRAQQVYEHMMGQEEGRKTLTAGLEPDSHEEAFVQLRSDTVNRKSSVWSRLSGRDKGSPAGRDKGSQANSSVKSKEKGVATSKHTTVSSMQDRMGNFLLCDRDDSVNMDVNNCTVEEPTDTDQLKEEFPINFKRRKNTRDCHSSEGSEDTQAKKRRKLIRPDFMDFTSSDDQWGEALESSQFEKAQTVEQKPMNEGLCNVNECVEDAKESTCPNSSERIMQPSDLFQTITEDGLFLGLSQVKRGNDYERELGSGSKKQDWKVDMCAKNNSQLASECSGVDPLASKGCNKAMLCEISIERGMQKQIELGLFGDICKKEVDDKEGNSRHSDGHGLIAESAVKASSDMERGSLSPDKIFDDYRLKKTADADKSIASRETVACREGERDGLIDLNQPFLSADSEHEEALLHNFITSRVLDDDSVGNVQNTLISDHCHDIQELQLKLSLCVDVKMVPLNLPSASTAEVETGETHGQGDRKGSSNSDLLKNLASVEADHCKYEGTQTGISESCSLSIVIKEELASRSAEDAVKLEQNIKL